MCNTSSVREEKEREERRLPTTTTSRSTTALRSKFRWRIDPGIAWEARGARHWSGCASPTSRHCVRDLLHAPQGGKARASNNTAVAQERIADTPPNFLLEITNTDGMSWVLTLTADEEYSAKSAWNAIRKGYAIVPWYKLMVLHPMTFFSWYVVYKE